jgi:hypothetical protein
MPLWWNGRHSTLKMSWAQARAGSSPTSGNEKEVSRITNQVEARSGRSVASL